MAKKLDIDIDDPNDPAIRYTNRFRHIDHRYARAVTDAYGGDTEAAMKDDDATVAARVREWEIAQGIDPRDWIEIGREERRGDPDERRDVSPFTGTTNPEQLAIMTEVLDSHCLTHNVVDKTDRAQIAIIITMLFEGGATTAHELKLGLERLWAD